MKCLAMLHWTVVSQFTISSHDLTTVLELKGYFFFRAIVSFFFVIDVSGSYPEDSCVIELGVLPAFIGFTRVLPFVDSTFGDKRREGVHEHGTVPHTLCIRGHNPTFYPIDHLTGLSMEYMCPGA